MSNPEIFLKGETVRVTFAGKTVDAVVILASSNGVSLALEFDAMLGGYVMTMPVLWTGEEFADLLTGRHVEITHSLPH